MTRKRNEYVAEKKRIEREADDTRRLNPRELEELDAVLRTPAGRGLYYRLVFLVCCIEDLTFASNIKDGQAAAQHTAFGEGVRSVGMTLRDEAQQYCPDLYLRMIEEQTALRLHDGRSDDS